MQLANEHVFAWFFRLYFLLNFKEEQKVRGKVKRGNVIYLPVDFSSVM